jgi:hypothetical protein
LIERFGLEHIWLLRKLGTRGTSLGVQRMMARPVSPFWRALSSTVGVQEPLTHTWLLREKIKGGLLAGLLQMMDRPGRPEAEIVYISPALSDRPEVQNLWNKLITHACAKAGERGIQRLLVDLPSGGGEVPIFRQAGFAIYAREEILRLESASCCARISPLPDGLRRPRSGDGFRLQELYATVTPRLVQMAEGQSPYGWRLTNNQHLPVWGEEVYLLQNEDGKLDAFLQLRPGAAGHWLDLILAPRVRSSVEALLDFGLERISGWSSKPVYTAVREYQGGLLPALHEKGFQPFGRQAAMVKFTTVLIKDPFPKLLNVIDKRVDPSAPTVTLLHSETSPESMSIPVAAGPVRD